MADRPIIFSGPMVCALLAGRKTQTRRLARMRPGFSVQDLIDRGEPFHVGYRATREMIAPSRIMIGDRLYVREAWAPLSACNHSDPGSQALADYGFYRADNSTVQGEIDRWRPSIHMPRSASRLTLRVTDVRVERLQSISDDDAWEEGVCSAVEAEDIRNGKPAWGDIPRHYRRLIVDQTYGGPARAFNWLWDSLHGRGSWDENPFVVAITFVVAHGNIDRLPSNPG